MRRILVHCHIYKNAGSSIDRLLWESFGDAFVVLNAMPGHTTIDPRSLRRFLNENRSVKAISSHQIHFPLDIPGALPIVFLRHPIDRAKSVYQFARMNPHMPDHRIACATSFAEYVGWSLGTRGDGAVLRNYQVHYLSSAAYRADDPDTWMANGTDLSEAKQTISTLPGFGLVRRFSESCRIFNTLYRPFLPAAEFFNRIDNSTGNPFASEEAVLARLRTELGSAAYAALESANALDLSLYDFAKTLFAQKLRRIDSAPSRLAAPVRLFAGRVRQRIMEPELYGPGPIKGPGTSQNPLLPANRQLPPWEA